jgi:hypothetical protein
MSGSGQTAMALKFEPTFLACSRNFFLKPRPHIRILFQCCYFCILRKKLFSTKIKSCYTYIYIYAPSEVSQHSAFLLLTAEDYYNEGLYPAFCLSTNK